MEELLQGAALVRMLCQPGGRRRLIPRAPVFLSLSSEGDNDRFVSLFRQAWQALKLWQRRAILAYWRRCNRGVPPLITMVSDELAGGNSGGNALGCCGLAGSELKFHAPSLAEMPDPLVVAVIAHELLHVCQFAKGWHVYQDTDAPWYCYELDENEIGVCQMLEDLSTEVSEASLALEEWICRADKTQQ